MSNFSCFVIGDSIVALRCLQILIKNDFVVFGVYSSDRSLASFTQAQNLFHADAIETFHTTLLNTQYDYLFSINNKWIIPSEVIACARKATINYHNSPLPKYAGLHATSWALIHGETQHAITWHEVVPTIDAGCILKQVTIPIQTDDTALNLNTRCYETAVVAFAQLVSELVENQVRFDTQDLSQRSYFGQRDRPNAACLLSFHHTTQELKNLVKALDFGPLYNPLGLPKLWLPRGVVAVAHAHSASDHQSAKPGQVLALDANRIWVATTDGAIALSSITTLEGTPLTEQQLKWQYGVEVGVVLPALNDQLQTAINQRNAMICQYEVKWVQHLAQLSPFTHPYLQLERARASQRGLHRYPIVLPSQVAPQTLLAMVAAYCARLSPEPEFDLALQTSAQRSVAPAIFAQSVPLRIQLQPDESFAQFQQRFASTLASTSRCLSYSLDVVVRYPELRDRPSLSLPVAIVLASNPTQVVFEHLNTTLAIVVYEDNSPAELMHMDALDHVWSQAIVEQLQTVMAACVDHPEHPVQSLPLLSAAERHRILVAWNQTATPYPSEHCIHELVSEQAARSPNALAVCYGNQQLTYAELERRSNQLARWLYHCGIRPETPVILCLPRSIDLIVGLIGILKAGGVYVPIDPSYPRERVTYLIADSQADLVVTIAALHHSLFPSTSQVICLDYHAAMLAELDSDPISITVDPEHLAYIIYTSGSTGQPKGVEISHRSLINHSWAIAKIYGLAPGDRVLQSASISFDIAAEQIYPALLRGAEIVIRPDDLMESFDRFTQFVQSRSITVLVLPTAFWHEWVIDLVTHDRPVPSGVRIFSVGTEKVLSHRLHQWQQLAGEHVAFFQGYGPTEATITCTLYQHQPGFTQQTVPIGRPLPNTEIYILDRHLEPVPIGMVGELYVGGDSLARGYYQRPHLTAASFIAHPFDPGNSQPNSRLETKTQDVGDPHRTEQMTTSSQRLISTSRLYKTGDLARFEPDGQIVYCGRLDHQVKIRGYRVELGEIEAWLNQHPHVKQAIVQPWELNPGHSSLIAYVIPKVRKKLTTDELQQWLQQKLPDYMHPSTIVFMDTLPLMPNGKINRRALPKPNQNWGLATTYIAPRDHLEAQLCEIWQTVLERQPIGIQDHFFELGGNSLSAVRLADQIQSALTSNLPLAAIFQAPTIAQYANLLRQPQQRSPWSTLVPLSTEGKQLPLFLFQGIDLYRPLASYLAPDRPVYGLSLEMIEPGLVFQSMDELVDRYIQEMRAVQPQGPYVLGGVSFGGMVALAVAQQLQADGQEVALLALLDTPAPSAFIPKPIYQRLRGHINNTVKFGFKYLVKKFGNRWDWVRFLRLRLTGDKMSHVDRYKAVQAAYKQMTINYTPQVYSGRVALFLATDRDALSNSICDPELVQIDAKFGWGNLVTGELNIYEVPGDHLGILKPPQVQVLAQQLKACLAERTPAPVGSIT